MQPIDVLMEDLAAPAGPLPPALKSLYGGGLHLADELVYANFVTSLDGVATLSAPGGGPAAISGRSEADRFVMALLRILADVVLVGAGTLRADSGHQWTAAYIHPPSRPHLAALAPEPRLAVVSASGDVDLKEPGLGVGSIVFTTSEGARRLARTKGLAEVVDLGRGPLSMTLVLSRLKQRGHRRVLTEGGPHLVAALVAEGVLDELFLTVSPVLAGRDGEERRLGLVEGVRLLPESGSWARLLSVRKHDSHLFLRYAFRRT